MMRVVRRASARSVATIRADVRGLKYPSNTCPWNVWIRGIPASSAADRPSSPALE